MARGFLLEKRTARMQQLLALVTWEESGQAKSMEKDLTNFLTNQFSYL